MPLVTAQQYNLVPNVQPLADRVSGLLMQRQANQREDEKLAEERRIEQARAQMLTTGAQLLAIRDLPADKQQTALYKAGQEWVKNGQDPSIFQKAASIQDPDERNTFLRHNAMKSEEIAQAFIKRQIGGRDNKFQFGGQVEYKDKDGNIFYGTTVRDPSSADIEASVVAADGSGRKPVGKLTIVGGTGQTAAEKLESDVSRAQQTEAIKTIETIKREQGKLREQLAIKPDIAKQTRLAELDAELAKEAFKQSNLAQKNINSLREVVRLVEEEGAETGPISDMLPSFRAATVELENLQKELGLNVVGAVTFGALSKGELDLALSKALPTSLDGPALVDWANRKIAAQQKLADYFQEQALFLSEGNSQADWIRHKRNQQPGQELTPEQMQRLEELRAKQ